MTALHVASSIDVVKYLHQQTEGQDLSKVMHSAANKGQKETLEYLIENGADLEGINKDGQTALICSAMNGHLEALTNLVEKGSNVEATDEKMRTALHWAAINGHSEIVKYLVEKSANIECKDLELKTALHWAAQKDKPAIAEILTDKNALLEVRDNNGMTALHLASKHHSMEIVEHLVGKNADVNAADNNNRIPLDYAASREIVNFFTKSKPTFVSISDSIDFAIARDHDAALEYFIEQKHVKLDERNAEGQTPLHVATKHCSYVIVCAHLQEDGVDINAKDNYGKTPFHYLSAKRSDDQDYSMDLDRMCKEGKDSDGEGLLQYSFFSYNMGSLIAKKKAIGIQPPDEVTLDEITSVNHNAEKLWMSEQFIEGKADIEAKDNQGRTPLHDASILGSFTLAHFLIEKGVKMNEKDNDGLTPLMHALKNENEDIAQLIIFKGAKNE